MKRFYESVGVAADGPVFLVTLDGRPLRTPGKNPLRLPTAHLAEAIGVEWSAQREEIRPLEMPMMRFAATTIDRVSSRRDEVIAEIAGYGGSDLLCYRADAPEELAARQEQAWQPLLDGCRARHGVALRVTAGVRHVPQDEAALATLREAVASHDDWGLMSLHAVTTASGSLVIALALIGGDIGPDRAWEAGHLDEAFQAERWGEDAEAAARRCALREEMASAARFFSLSRA